jgi:multiple sugar transport system substrate-binding protein
VYYLFSGWTKEAFMDEIGNFIVRKYPNVSIKFLQNEQSSTLAGLQYLVTNKINVDLMVLTPPAYSSVKEVGLNANIAEQVKKFGYNLGALDDQVLDVLRAAGDGQLPGLPYKTIPLTLLYNRDVFDKFGIEYLKDGMTWDDYYNITKRLTRVDGGVTYLGFANHQMGGYISNNQLSLPLVDPQTNKSLFNTTKWKTYMDNIVRFYQIPGMDMNDESLKGTTGSGAYTLFTKNQTVASILTYSSNYPKKAQGIQMNWDAAQYPVFPEAPGVGSMPHMVFLALSANSPNKDAAFLAMTALAGQESQFAYARLGTVPVLKDLTEAMKVFGTGTEDLKGRNVKGLVPKKYAGTIPYSKYAEIASAAIATQVDQVIMNKKDMNTALRDAEEQTNKRIQEQLGK